MPSVRLSLHQLQPVDIRARLIVVVFVVDDVAGWHQAMGFDPHVMV
jgi:hypothetical protein